MEEIILVGYGPLGNRPFVQCNVFKPDRSCMKESVLYVQHMYQPDFSIS